MRVATTFASLLVVFVMSSVAVLMGCGGGVSKEYRPKTPITRWDDSDWATVLTVVVTPDGYVRHDLLQSNKDGARDALYRHVGKIGEVSPENRPELFPTDSDKLAYYLNAYNALCMYAVVKRDFPSNMKTSGIFILDRFPVGGTSYSLDSLEKSKVRSAGDPRIHFALNCMSKSCPPLLGVPYAGATLNEQLNSQGKIYLSDPRGAQKGDPGTVKLSEIFTRFYPDEWIAAYEKQSGKKGATLIESLQQYAAPGSPVIGATKFESMTYDWSLNRP